MTLKTWFRNVSIAKKYHYKWVFLIAVTWTLVDFARFFIFAVVQQRNDYPYTKLSFGLFVIRFLFVFSASFLMGWLIVFKLKRSFRTLPIWTGILLKTFVLSIITLAIYTLLFIVTHLVIYGHNFETTINALYKYKGNEYRLLNSLGIWLLIFITTQLIIEVNEKYSPGIFRAILLGKYIDPKEETKIIMFIDLKDSTMIAEQLGHKKYFLFMRDFIYHISSALLNHGGDIYQYVGDEVVVSWPCHKDHKSRCVKALIEARKNLQKETDHFRTDYGIVPEFRAGIHCGPVMIGEIGVIKKDLAMSGDTMNTTARMKAAATDLNRRFIVSKDLLNEIGLEDFQAESFGMIELKGKEEGLELFYLKI